MKANYETSKVYFNKAVFDAVADKFTTPKQIGSICEALIFHIVELQAWCYSRLLMYAGADEETITKEQDEFSTYISNIDWSSRTPTKINSDKKEDNNG